MIGASSHSGDTLIACHFPVVQLPTWQLPVQALCSSSKRPGRLCAVGLTRAVSLPESDSINRVHAFNTVRRHVSSSYSSMTEDRAEEEGTSDSSGRCEPTSSPEDSSSQIKRGSCQGKVSVRSHNSFLPTTDMDDEEADEDSDGDNLHRYHEDSSFVLHGNSNWQISDGVTDLNSYVDSDWGNEGAMFGVEPEQEWRFKLSNQMGDLQPKCQCYHMSNTSMEMMACGEQSTNTLKRNTSCCIHSLQKCSPEFFSSDSSCNSSDGVLVNFCTIYNRSNNPATPLDLSSPSMEPPAEGSVFLNLHPVPQIPLQEPRSEWSPHGLDTNYNMYSLEPLPPGLTSLEASDLNACLQSQAVLPMETNQKYYKLVPCDLASQSPSPAWSSSTSCLGGQGRSSSPSGEDRQQKESKKDQHMERSFSAADFSVASTSTASCRRKHTEGLQSLLQAACLLCSSQRSPQGSKSQGTSTDTTQPSVNLDQDHSDAEVSDSGACSVQTPVVRFSKAQRPTSLPIQPFVLVPTEKPPLQSQHLGGLLEQYIHQKSSSQPSFTFKGKRSQCFTNLQLSPMGSQCPIFLEAPSSSDTCSTCTPSPDCFRHVWSRSGTSPSMLQTHNKLTFDKTSPYSDKYVYLQTNNRPTLVKIPTYQNLIHLTPEQHDNHLTKKMQSQSKCNSSDGFLFTMTPPTLPLTADTCHSNLQVSVTPPTAAQAHNILPQYGAAPGSDHGFFHNTLTAAVAPLSSLLRSLTSSGINPLQDAAGRNGRHTHSHHRDCISERPPTEFCLSPDSSYESMSISHLQRRGLLRAVSRAVDLIMAHFGSSRDPDEKMRLGNSSRSPTISGLILEHLCPSIQNILEDGLRDHKLDLIIGQRRTHTWSIVEVSTRIGPSTKVLNCLVSKIQQYPQLTDHCMRLRAFIMGLLNLRALEFWLSHLQSQKDVVSTYYHSWGFLSMSLGRCQPLFQELLLLLQPLSVLPFDLNLLLEPRLLHNRQLCLEEHSASPPAPSSGLLATSWPLLQADRKLQGGYNNLQLNISHQLSPRLLQQDTQLSSSLFSANAAGWWTKETEPVDGVVDGEECLNDADHWSQISMDSRQEEPGEQRDTPVLTESQSGLRWAKLFGAPDLSTSSVTVAQSHSEAQTKQFNKRPSQWLHLNRSQLGLLAQSIMSKRLKGAVSNK